MDKRCILFTGLQASGKTTFWQQRFPDVGVSFQDVQKEGFNPMKQEKVFTVRRERTVNNDLPLGDDYRQYILKLLADAVENG